MPIVTDLGIPTEELCEDSKKYLSRLLADRIIIGASIKNPNFVSWEELLSKKQVKLGEDLIKRLDSLLRKNAEYVGPSIKRNLKQHIVDTLIKLESQHREEKYLESKKQQEDLRHQKRALISIAIIIGLAVAYPFALPLLGGMATFVGTVVLAIGATLLCCSIIPAFFGERLIDTEWMIEAQNEKKQFLQGMEKQKIQANYTKIIKTINKIPIAEKEYRFYQHFLDKDRLLPIKEHDEEKLNTEQILRVKNTVQNERNKPEKPSTVEVATQTTTNSATTVIYSSVVR